MPIYTRYDGIDIEPASVKESYAQGEVLIHIESTVGDTTLDDLTFGDDDSTVATGNVEVMVKVLDFPRETPVDGGFSSWLVE